MHPAADREMSRQQYISMANEDSRGDNRGRNIPRRPGRKLPGKRRWHVSFPDRRLSAGPPLVNWIEFEGSAQQVKLPVRGVFRKVRSRPLRIDLVLLVTDRVWNTR